MRNSRQIEMISLEDLVPETHAYRKIKELVNFSKILKKSQDIEKEEGAKGYGIDRLFFVYYCSLWNIYLIEKWKDSYKKTIQRNGFADLD